MTESQVSPLFPEAVSEEDELVLSERRTPELVLGFVGPVGSGVTLTANIFSELLEDDFKYEVFNFKVSQIIEQTCELIGESYDASLTKEKRIARLQELGDKLRMKFSPSYLAEKVIENIAAVRVEKGYNKQSGTAVALPKRFCHIVDSIKNPAEAKILRDVYGDSFWLIGVFAPQSVREDRLKANRISAVSLQNIINKDEDEDFEYGQKVRDVIQESDFFVRNDGENEEKIRKSIDRYLRIIFNIGVNTPTMHESAMYTAVSAAANSACLSRQVGASIYSSDNELLGVGSNDVPKFGGGLYSIEDASNDHRCFKWGSKICHNDNRKERLYEKIWTTLKDENIIGAKINYDKLKSALQNTDIKNLIEYSRSVHAEMEALISVARGSKSGLVGATLYCTTFPCHNCARHIVASGISRVIYIEPYPKSLAMELHKDAISVKENIKNKVVFLQYDGVAPKNVVRFFKHGAQRKSQGKLIIRRRDEALPVSPPPLDGFNVHEQIVVSRLAKLEQKMRENR